MVGPRRVLDLNLFDDFKRLTLGNRLDTSDANHKHSTPISCCELLEAKTLHKCLDESQVGF